MRAAASGLLLALAGLLLAPDALQAWGPGTHVALGEMVLGSLYLLPPAVKALLERFPLHFLYGSVAADISLAKKYVPEGRHCHHWHVGEEILEEAGNETEALQAMGYGYLAHLAADTVAHNLFVPRRLLLTSTTQSMGHTYWEHRMDVHVGQEYLEKARHVVMENDHSDADALFDRVLSSTIFSFRMNRRIFRGMIQFQGDDRWMQVFDRVLQNSRYDLPDPLVRRYLALSYDYVVDYLRDREGSRPAALDPIGDLNLRLAKKVRHRALAEEGRDEPERMLAVADDFFPFPEGALVFWPRYLAEERRVEPGPAEEADATGALAPVGHPPAIVTQHLEDADEELDRLTGPSPSPDSRT